jgi:deoxyribonuclease IV
MFENDKLRLGPPSVRQDLFFMPNEKGRIRKGKKYEIPQYLTEMGLNAYEFSAGRMAKFADSPDYEKFRINVEKYDLAVSIHAPYYISLTSESEETYERTIERVANVYAWAVWLKAKRIVVHPGTYGKKKRSLPTLIQQIVEGVNRGIDLSYELFPKMKNDFKNICLCLETMGKFGQLGTTDEIILLCKELGLNRVRPCIDFGHLYTRYVGKKTGTKLYQEVFEKIESELGKEIAENLHIHWSKIEFTPKGEKAHVTNTNMDWGPNITPLLEYVKEHGYTPIIINESPELEPDTKLLMDEWNLINTQK